MKKFLHAALTCCAVALSMGPVLSLAQESVLVSDSESSNRWFVELQGAPTADGNSLASVRAEKKAFKQAAAAARIAYKELRSFDVLFNGYSVQVDAINRAKLARIDGVKALWPVLTVEAPTPPTTGGSAPDLATAIAMTGADVVQNSLGFDGTGVKVAVMDTGIDYDNGDLGGDGVQRSNSNVFPTARVIAGYDFVGDNYDAANPASPPPAPDAYPDDCGGHGTHVAGIVGANGDVVGVAPGVKFGSYRVFGCVGSTDSDIMLAAMERALADGMQVLNMSIGSSFQWPQYPTGAAATRLVNKGMVVVASIGNSGPQGSTPNGLYSAGAPGVGAKVIGVASFDNTHVRQPAFAVSPDGTLVGYGAASGAPAPPTSGSLPMSKTGTTSTANDGCAALPAGSQTGNAVLIRRGTCSFYQKAFNAQSAGAAAVVLYNNAAGFVSPTVAGTPPITIPVVMTTDAAGALIDGRIAGGATTMTWTDQLTSTPNPTGGLISGFSSFGLAADLSLKPDIGAPGGSIYSTVPLELGGHGQNSGTSMSSPHVAGAAALMLEARPDTSSSEMRSRLQNSADPKNWWNNPNLGLLDNVHRQGAGMLDIDDSILSTVRVEPGKLSLGESAGGSSAATLTISNDGASGVTFDLSHQPALATGPQNATNYANVSYFSAPSSVAFSAPSVFVPAGGTATVNVTITPNASLADRSTHGGYLVLTPQGGGAPYRVPYAGVKGDYQSIQVLTPTVNGFPWLAQLVGPSFFNRPTGGTFTLVGNDDPFFLVHLDHQSRIVRFEAFTTDGKSWHRISNDEYVGRNSTAGGFFAFQWDGTTSNGSKTFVVPDGQYVAKLSVLKALGDANDPAHWETWTSPVITIDRP